MLTMVLLFASAQVSLADSAPARSLDLMTQIELTDELRRLEARRPGLAAPIAVIAAGLGVDLASTGLSIVSGLSRFTTPPIFEARTQPLVFWTGIGLVATALVVAGLGALWLRFRLRERRPWSDAIEQVQQRLEAPAAPRLDPAQARRSNRAFGPST